MLAGAQFAQVNPTVLAAATTGLFFILGQAFVTITNRRWMLGKDRREEIAEQRADEDSEIDRFAELAKTALEREKLAYNQKVYAEEQLHNVATQLQELVTQKQIVDGNAKSLEGKVADMGRACDDLREQLDQCRRHIRLTEQELARRGIKLD